MKYGSMREVKHIMESITIRIKNVVRKWITNKNSIPLQITSTAVALGDFDLKVIWEPFLTREVTVKRWQG